MLTATQHALDLPELVAYIIAEVAFISQWEAQTITWNRRIYRKCSDGLKERWNAVFQCVLVNKRWNREGTRVLWEVNPPPQAFHNLHRSRRQHFANMVRAVQVKDPYQRSPKNIFARIPGVQQFPSLKTLDFKTGLDDNPRFRFLFSLLLHSELQHLRFGGGLSNGSRYIADELFPLIQVRISCHPSSRLRATTHTF
jgi:hypothetical protein